jgi:SAM-dependent methyltransferase
MTETRPFDPAAATKPAVTGAPVRRRACRFCGAPVDRTFVDLGMAPPCEAILTAEQLERAEVFYPLHAVVCDRCFLVQLSDDLDPAGIYSEYAYFSSYSEAWVDHARRYVHEAVERFELGADSLVVEIASNDGYLLQHARRVGLPVLGIEPARNVAAVARRHGIPTVVEFFGTELANRLRAGRIHADLIVANNVLAHVPDLNDFVEGVRTLLAAGGVATFEFPHLLRLVEGNQFDTIYHEHYSYFSLLTATMVFEAHGLEVFDVEELWTHGGSLRLFVQHQRTGRQPMGAGVRDVLDLEYDRGLGTPAWYAQFAPRVEATKRRLLSFLIDARDRGRRVAGYGAPGKGNTLLNYCGIRGDLLEFTVDRNPYKHGRFLPGTHIPVHPVDHLWQERPDDIVILPWNLRDEIGSQLAGTRDWGARLVVPIPDVELVEAPSFADARRMP